MSKEKPKDPTGGHESGFLKLHRYGLIGFHASLVTLSVTLIYGCFVLWPVLLDAGRSTNAILLTIIAAALSGLANGLASYKLFVQGRDRIKEIDYNYVAFALALLMVMAAISIFDGF